MANPIGVYNEVGQFAVQFGTTRTLPLNRENEVKMLKLRLEVVHTNGATPALTVTDLLRLVQEIRIVGGGKNNVKMVGGLKAYLNYVKNHSIAPASSINLTANTAGLTSWVIIEVPFMMFDMKRPHDSIFPSYRFQNLDLKVQFGAATGLGTNVTFTSGNVTVYEDAIENYSRDVGEAYGFFKEIYQSKIITANNPKEPIVLPVDMLYKQLSFATFADGVLVDTVINGIVIKSGSKVIRSYAAKELKEHMKRRIKNDSVSLVGLYYVDFGERGHVTEFLNTVLANGGFKQLSIELDVTHQGTTTLIEQYSDYLDIVPVTQGA